MQEYEYATLAEKAEKSKKYELRDERERHELIQENNRLKMKVFLKEKEIYDIYEKLYYLIYFSKGKEISKKKLLSMIKKMENQRNRQYMPDFLFNDFSTIAYTMDGYDMRTMPRRKGEQNDRYC